MTIGRFLGYGRAGTLFQHASILLLWCFGVHFGTSRPLDEQGNGEQVFDVTRKSTYQNLSKWYSELREYCENIPCYLGW